MLRLRSCPLKKPGKSYAYDEELNRFYQRIFAGVVWPQTQIGACVIVATSTEALFY